MKTLIIFTGFIFISIFILISHHGNANEMKHEHTILCLGDSYTIGEQVSETDRFPVQLVKMLRDRKIEFADPVIIAHTGWTTDELIAAVKDKNLTGTFDYVTLLIGVNNQYRGYPSDNYRKEFIELLQTAVKYAGGNASHVIVISIPDWGVTPYAAGRDRKKIGEEIDLFNSINKEEAQKSGAKYVDITPTSRQAANDPTLIADDGLHPSGKMYALWCEQILPLIK